jgi:hypothetical protein
MKKRRIPFFTLCGILAACILLYFNAQKERVSEQNTSVNAVLTPQNDSYPVQEEPGTFAEYEISEIIDEAPDRTLERDYAITREPIAQEESTKSQPQDLAITAPQEITLAADLTEENKPRTITIKNGITPSMLAYAHWTGTYTPSIFTLEVNDKTLALGEQIVTPLIDDTFTASYYYSFMNGYKSGARKVTLKVDHETPFVELGFSWKSEWHVISDQASPESIENIEFKEKHA